MNLVMFWATVLSPIIGAIAIVVALHISNKSSKETQKQIEAIHNLLDIFVAAQNPTMLEAKKKYEQQLAQLNFQIEDSEEELEMAKNSFAFNSGVRIDVIDAREEVEERRKTLSNLLAKQKELNDLLDVINDYINKVYNDLGEINNTLNDFINKRRR